jgi:hypothetical protein
VFNDDVFNSDVSQDARANRPTLDQISSVQNGVFTSPPLTTDDIISTNNGFISAFKTVYIEPLGLAENVLASEAQEVPRATISSTIFGKVTTIIDDKGFLKDVNVITFESGFGTKIVGNGGSNSLTFSVTGLTLGSLENVLITDEKDGDILVFDSEIGKWVNRVFPTPPTPPTTFYYQQQPPDAGVTQGTRWMSDETGIEYIYVFDGDSAQWVQASTDGSSPINTNETRLVTGSEYVAADFDYFIGVSYDGMCTIVLPANPEDGQTVVVKDVSGEAGRSRNGIVVVGATSSHTIDNSDYVTLNINNGALQLLFTDGWRII